MTLAPLDPATEAARRLKFPIDGMRWDDLLKSAKSSSADRSKLTWDVIDRRDSASCTDAMTLWPASCVVVRSSVFLPASRDVTITAWVKPGGRCVDAT